MGRMFTAGVWLRPWGGAAQGYELESNPVLGLKTVQVYAQITAHMLSLRDADVCDPFKTAFFAKGSRKKGFLSPNGYT